MPLFVLAELRLGAARSRQATENGAQVEALARRCKVIVADLDTIPFYIRVRNTLAGVRTVPQSLENAKHSGTISGLPHSASSSTSRF
jgi:predicted nucleic acid-binding protein